MAIRRTREQKMRALERRKAQYAFGEQQAASDGTPPGNAKKAAVSAKPAKVSSQSSDSSPTVLTVAPKQPITSPMNTGLAKDMERTALYLRTDLQRTLIVTVGMILLLIGIWWATRYNGVSIDL